MPATTTPDAPADKRDAIIDAALELFSEHTFEGTPVPLIAERAGVAAGTIYRYFENKEDLVNAVYQRTKSAMRAAILDGVPPDADARAVFSATWRGLWRFASSQPRAFSFLETHHHAAYINESSRALGREIDAQLVAYVRASQAAGAMRDAPPDMLIALVFGAFVGLVKSAGEEGLGWDEDSIEKSEACMWAAVCA